MKIIDKAITEIKEYINNPRFNDNAVSKVVESIKEFGFKVPIIIDKNDEIIAGHTRFKAAKELGLEKVPCLVASDLTPEQVKAFRLADNKVSEYSSWDEDKLYNELMELKVINFDVESFGFDTKEIDISTADIDGILEKFEEPTTTEETNREQNRLIDDFLVPPFSVFDTKQGYWQDRKRKWLEITGDLVATKEDVLGGSGLRILAEKHGSKTLKGTSQFDSVLCEVIYKWFSRDGAKILDPFGGEQTKGVVAGELGFKYEAVEFRQDQVDYNKEKTSKYEGIKYHCGDSNNISEIIKDRGFNLCFTSPPYYDLEVYSKEDMSSLGTYEEFMQQYENIFSKCYSMLEENSFLIVKVGEIRNKKTGQYRGFVADNIKIMERIGFKFYNEIILLNQIATAALRTKAQMNNRKVVKIHQNVLVFYKGELNEISEHFKKLNGSDYIDSE